jgi:hypothetical protein
MKQQAFVHSVCLFFNPFLCVQKSTVWKPHRISNGIATFFPFLCFVHDEGKASTTQAVTTRVAVDHNMHQDFQPTSKSLDMSFSDIVALVYILLY